MLYAYNMEGTVLIQAAFLAPLIFLVLYSRWHSWWVTVHGRTLGTLAGAIPVILLHTVLGYWHITTKPSAQHAITMLAQQARLHPEVAAALAQLNMMLQPNVGDWVSLQFLLLVPVAFGVMSWQVLRPHTPWLSRLQCRVSCWLSRRRHTASDQAADPLTRDASDVRREHPSSR